MIGDRLSSNLFQPREPGNHEYGFSIQTPICWAETDKRLAMKDERVLDRRPLVLDQRLRERLLRPH